MSRDVLMIPSLQLCKFQISRTRIRNQEAESEARLGVENARKELSSAEADLQQVKHDFDQAWTQVVKPTWRLPPRNVCVRCRRSPREVISMCCWGVAYCVPCERRARKEEQGCCGLCRSSENSLQRIYFV